MLLFIYTIFSFFENRRNLNSDEIFILDLVNISSSKLFRAETTNQLKKCLKIILVNLDDFKPFLTRMIKNIKKMKIKEIRKIIKNDKDKDTNTDTNTKKDTNKDTNTKKDTNNDFKRFIKKFIQLIKLAEMNEELLKELEITLLLLLKEYEEIYSKMKIDISEDWKIQINIL